VTQVESPRSRQVEGLIVATARRDHPLLARLHHLGMKMVRASTAPPA
jgi:LacI family transcriptional regulator